MKGVVLAMAVITLAGLSCKSPVDFEKEKKAIMVLHNEQRQAHIEKNVSLLFSDSLTDYVEVNRGTIEKPTQADLKRKFQAYFDAVDFIQWDDIAQPILSFSDDATMATTVVDKMVITKNKQGDRSIDTSHYTWLAVYKKIDGKWRLHRMGSTNK